MNDNLTHEGAERLAMTITAYWRDMGYQVNAVAEPMTWDKELRISGYQVRTDLVNGRPRGRA